MQVLDFILVCLTKKTLPLYNVEEIFAIKLPKRFGEFINSQYSFLKGLHLSGCTYFNKKFHNFRNNCCTFNYVPHQLFYSLPLTLKFQIRRALNFEHDQSIHKH